MMPLNSNNLKLKKKRGPEVGCPGFVGSDRGPGPLPRTPHTRTTPDLTSKKNILIPLQTPELRPLNLYKITLKPFITNSDPSHEDREPK